MNIASNGARLLASWTWRLMLVSAAALLLLVIGFVGLRRYDWLVCQCYGHCIPSVLLLVFSAKPILPFSSSRSALSQ